MAHKKKAHMKKQSMKDKMDESKGAKHLDVKQDMSLIKKMIKPAARKK